jgi:hypothetical protein
MTGERVDQHTVEEIVGLRGMTDDELVDILLDQPAALAIADRIRAAATGGDTVADRGHADRATTPDAEARRLGHPAAVVVPRCMTS